MATERDEEARGAWRERLSGIDPARLVFVDESSTNVAAIHFQRNVLSQVPASSMPEVAENLSAIFKVSTEKAAEALVKEFVLLYQKSYPKAVSVFEAGVAEALSYLSFPGSHHARIRSTNMLERLFKEVKRRTRVVGVFPNETNAAALATETALRSSEEWALRRYLTMNALEAYPPGDIPTSASAARTPSIGWASRA